MSQSKAQNEARSEKKTVSSIQDSRSTQRNGKLSGRNLDNISTYSFEGQRDQSNANTEPNVRMVPQTLRSLQDLLSPTGKWTRNPTKYSNISSQRDGKHAKRMVVDVERVRKAVSSNPHERVRLSPTRPVLDDSNGTMRPHSQRGGDGAYVQQVYSAVL